MVRGRGPLGLNPFEAAILTPGPLGHNDAASPDQYLQYRGHSPGPVGINDFATPDINRKRSQIGTNPACPTSGFWDPQAAASFLKDPANGWADMISKGRCARAVRQAINAGHIATPANPVAAADYNKYLLMRGFVPVDVADYKPQVGDIAVFPAIPGTRHIYGHIQMYNGQRWQSDFMQPAKAWDGVYGKGFFANRIWTTKPFTIFRREAGK